MTIKLMQGDCLAEMDKLIEQGVTVDAIITDPPFGTTACKWDSVIPFDAMWARLNKIIKPNGAIVMMASQPFTTTLISSNMKMFKYCWVWEKSHPSGIALVNKRVMKRHEDICIFYTKQPTYIPQKWVGNKSHSVGKQLGRKTKSVSNPNMVQTTTEYSNMKHPKSVVYFPNPRIKGQHPTQKPVALMEYFIKTYTNEGETVLDFTMGSGTTMVAANNLNRHGIGIELDEGYFKIAQERISAA